jgi:hypothetical protein
MEVKPTIIVVLSPTLAIVGVLACSWISPIYVYHRLSAENVDTSTEHGS